MDQIRALMYGGALVIALGAAMVIAAVTGSADYKACREEGEPAEFGKNRTLSTNKKPHIVQGFFGARFVICQLASPGRIPQA